MSESNGYKRAAIWATILVGVIMFALGLMSHLIGAEMRFAKRADFSRLENKMDAISIQMATACQKLAVIEQRMNDHDHLHQLVGEANGNP